MHGPVPRLDGSSRLSLLWLLSAWQAVSGPTVPEVFIGKLSVIAQAS